MIDLIQTSQLLLSISLAISALKKSYHIATIMMILLFVVLYSIKG